MTASSIFRDRSNASIFRRTSRAASAEQDIGPQTPVFDLPYLVSSFVPQVVMLSARPGPERRLA